MKEASYAQSLLNKAVNVSVENGVPWTRERSGNGRLQSWRLPLASNPLIKVMIWPVAKGYLVKTSDPDSTFRHHDFNLSAALKIAEEYATTH